MTSPGVPLIMIALYHCRQHMILAKQKSEEAKGREDAAEQDLFSDMAPTIKRQKKPRSISSALSAGMFQRMKKDTRHILFEEMECL